MGISSAIRRIRINVPGLPGGSSRSESVDPAGAPDERLLAARYLAGLLSPADARRFEQAVRADPARAERMGLAEQVGRASQLVATGELWTDRTWWRDPRLLIGAAAAIVALLVLALWLSARVSSAEHQSERLQAQAEEGFIRAPSTTRIARATPAAAGQLRVGAGEFAERLEIRIAVPGDKFRSYNVALARDDGVSIFNAERLQRDSNGELILQLNSSVLPAGAYSIRLEGVTARGRTEPAGRIRLSVSGR